VYFHEVYKKGFGFKHFSGQNLQRLNQYLIKSQINDWGLQSYVDNFSRIISEASAKGSGMCDFPLQAIEDHILKTKKRNIEIHEDTFIDYAWFALKILTPTRIYQFAPDMVGRFNPELDHIFPKKLENWTAAYIKAVDIVWNMQPTKGEINGFKTNLHPRDFFLDKARNSKGEPIVGSKYITEYDFLFPQAENNGIDFTNVIWEAPIEFVQRRRELMIEFLKHKYGIVFRMPEKTLGA